MSIIKKRKFDYIATKPNILHELLFNQRQVIPDSRWDWYALTINPNISKAAIQQFKDRPWNKGVINRKFSIRSLINAPWDRMLMRQFKDENETDWSEISANPRITLPFVLKNIDKINFRVLSDNYFLWDDIAYARAIAADIAERRKRIKEILLKNVFAAVIKYIDYI